MCWVIYIKPERLSSENRDDKDFDMTRKGSDYSVHSRGNELYKAVVRGQKLTV